MNIKQIMNKKDEKPLEHLLDDGGFTSIFRTIGCIGDSLSSGEFESLNDLGEKEYHDFFEYSWGQYLGRMIGSRVYNFSRGGMRVVWTPFCPWHPALEAIISQLCLHLRSYRLPLTSSSGI